MVVHDDLVVIMCGHFIQIRKNLGAFNNLWI